MIKLVSFGILTAIIILFSILFHEIVHSFASKHYGLRIKEIELNFLGGFTKLEGEPTTPKSEEFIALVGPISNLLIGTVILAFFYIFQLRIQNYLLASLFFAGASNLAIGIFNLIPAYPLDGGRILRAYFWSKSKDFYDATYLACKVSVFIGYCIIVYGIYLIFILEVVASFWLLSVGFLLIFSAKHAFKNSTNRSRKKS
ncbi:MAG: site-2 protease family protein [Candidatus Hodarchaeota archaeon]